MHNYGECGPFVTRIRDLFNVFEGLGVRVGTVWLSPVHVPELQADVHCYDTVSAHVLQLDQDRGGTLVGYLFGAAVYSSDLVPKNHIAVIPDGFEAKLVDGAASFPI